MENLMYVCPKCMDITEEEGGKKYIICSKCKEEYLSDMRVTADEWLKYDEKERTDKTNEAIRRVNPLFLQRLYDLDSVVNILEQQFHQYADEIEMVESEVRKAYLGMIKFAGLDKKIFRAGSVRSRGYRFVVKTISVDLDTGKRTEENGANVSDKSYVIPQKSLEFIVDFLNKAYSYRKFCKNKSSKQENKDEFKRYKGYNACVRCGKKPISPEASGAVLTLHKGFYFYLLGLGYDPVQIEREFEPLMRRKLFPGMNIKTSVDDEPFTEEKLLREQKECGDFWTSIELEECICCVSCEYWMGKRRVKEGKIKEAECDSEFVKGICQKKVDKKLVQARNDKCVKYSKWKELL